MDSCACFQFFCNFHCNYRGKDHWECHYCDYCFNGERGTTTYLYLYWSSTLYLHLPEFLSIGLCDNILCSFLLAQRDSPHPLNSSEFCPHI